MRVKTLQLIVGPGSANLAINGNFPSTTNRVFHVTSNLVVTIAGLTITNGHAPASFPSMEDPL